VRYPDRDRKKQYRIGEFYLCDNDGASQERDDMDSAKKPSVLFVYYSYTQQTLKVVEAMAEALRNRGCETFLGAIEFTDPRYAGRFKTFPMPHPYREVLGMLLPVFRGKVGEIHIPDVVTEREYDLVVIGSPTWCFPQTSRSARSCCQKRRAGS
jgi:hypothetical protein